MELCVGATSRLMAEEAAKLQVAQVIASRRQVNASGGYTGMTQQDLVKIVAENSGGKTLVIRDHGGPHQNGEADDDWVAELDEDVSAGFHGLHLDVSALPYAEQVPMLRTLACRYASRDMRLLVGGERDSQPWLFTLLGAVLSEGIFPAYAVIAVGGHTHADRQTGRLISPVEAAHITTCYRALGVQSVAHNMDFSARWQYVSSVSAVNVAPEFAVAETDAWLRAVPDDVRSELLKAGLDASGWHRWFDRGEGSYFERARCGLRYIWADEQRELMSESWYPEAEEYVREEVCHALSAG